MSCFGSALLSRPKVTPTIFNLCSFCCETADWCGSSQCTLGNLPESRDHNTLGRENKNMVSFERRKNCGLVCVTILCVLLRISLAQQTKSVTEDCKQRCEKSYPQHTYPKVCTLCLHELIFRPRNFLLALNLIMFLCF